MKISIDLDGCLWHHQTFFRDLMRGMQSAGHQVGILTSHKKIHISADLALLEKRGFPLPDFYFDRPNGVIDYAAYKAHVILERGIDLHFEDGLAEEMRALLLKDAYRVVSVAPRGTEEQHFD
jgi:hypothetical protein